ncbi:MAG: endonuclease/exonuclease/phosphatase family protein [Metamycoplasmataceae bacterium]
MLKRNIFKIIGSAMVFSPFVMIASCNSTAVDNKDDVTKDIKISQFNISFATDGDPTESYQRWFDFLSVKKPEQDALVKKIKDEIVMEDEEKALAERIAQIRNIAAIIQANKPDVILLNEFNNDGNGEDKQIMKLFQDNFLSHPQSMNSIDGGELLEPIVYPFYETYATNTGLKSGMDLNNDGLVDNVAEDAFGFGFYHGHYAFGVMSKYEIDTANTRTFQEFKWKDLPNAKIPKIVEDNGKIPPGMQVGDNWYTDEEWDNFRLSSKNHVDVPIKVKVGNTVENIHLLLSHPTPPAFELGGTNVNLERNLAEVQFWTDYINNNQALYDDNGVRGGIDGAKEKFVILGDLNSDNLWGNTADKVGEGIRSLIASDFVNKSIVNGDHIPKSKGGELETNSNGHPKPETRTSVFGLRVDWSLPSANLDVIDSGVYWQAEGEKGRLLFNDPRIGRWGNSKEISSDHRFVWSTIRLTSK